MRDALRIGISVETFWAMTPREMAMAFEAAAWQDRTRERAALTQAWTIAALSRSKKLVSLRTLLAPLQDKQGMTPEEIEQRRQEFLELKQRLGNVGSRARKSRHPDSGDAGKTR